MLLQFAALPYAVTLLIDLQIHEPMSLKTPWHCLPAEIRLLVLEALPQVSGRLAGFAIVSREWQKTIERHNFARIKLTPSRLADFDSMIYRNRALVRYIWLCLELEEYGCPMCAPRGMDIVGISDADNALITATFVDLFSVLSTWESKGNLLLDISVHSPSDSEHWFKYLTFEPDISSDECGRYLCEEPPLVKLDDHQHGWTAGNRDYVPSSADIHKVFDEIMGEGPFCNDEQENQWWQQLPLVPAVTGILLRQQSRRRWKPTALAQMFSRLPQLQGIHYEPWREWYTIQQHCTDECECYSVSSSFLLYCLPLTTSPTLVFDVAFQSLFESLAPSRLRRLVLFENFNQQYPISFSSSATGCDAIRTPAFNVSEAVARASLNLEHLSASFIVDASYFFDARKPLWRWPDLTSIALTSQLLAPDESPAEIDNMLRSAAAAAMTMPRLETMEIWNGREGLAMLFRYQLARGGGPAVITCRGTWEFALRTPVVQAWEGVALKNHGQGCVIVKYLLNDGIESHGDAIHHLKLSSPVIRPISLQQIRMEHRICKGVKN